MVDDHDSEAADIVASMSDIEQVDLLSGHGLWKTSSIGRLGIPAVTMTDGTYGVRYSTTQINSGEDPGAALRDFLAVVNRRADDDSREGMFGTTHPATCFPNGNLLGCSWDVDLAFALGQALADECRSLGVQLLLGPGINIRRTPLAGRAYEYYSEDPVVSGDLAAGLIRGLQGSGVGASLKHFACNNSEIDRTNMSSDVDERALREIYLAGFERAIAKSDPWTLMSAYNPVNGVQSAEHHWLLTKVLREEWGFSGLVISDWHAIKDRPASLHAGTDLDMPESAPRKKSLLAALEAGSVDRQALDRSCMRILSLVRRLSAAAAPAAAIDLDVHHRLARRMAAESIVLLKNDNACLPLNPEGANRILVIGDGRSGRRSRALGRRRPIRSVSISRLTKSVRLPADRRLSVSCRFARTAERKPWHSIPVPSRPRAKPIPSSFSPTTGPARKGRAPIAMTSASLQARTH
jgi:beta-glucosidase